MATKQTYYVGTDLKFAIDITAEGFDMDSDDYSIVLRCGRVTKDIDKDEIVTVANDDGNEHYLLVDTTEFGNGTLEMIVTAAVPDTDFPDGIRHEVVVTELCRINNVGG